VTDLVQYLKDRQQDMVDLLTTMVGYETFTIEKEYVDRFANFMEGQFTALGAAVTRFPQTEVGDCLLAKWNEDAPGKPILFLVHIDTVWPIGTLAERPVRIEPDGRLYGPGAVDMKGGITVMLFAIKSLLETGQMPNRPVWVMMNSDEETGSDHSEHLIKDAARHAGLVLVMEPATKEGALKTWRKGIASYVLSIEGRPSHAGNAPEQGINSIVEFAQQVMEINKLNDLKNGTSVSVTMVKGGSAGNVIPAATEAYIDTRMMRGKVLDELDNALTNLHPFIPGAKLSVKRTHARPPMERSEAAYEQCKRIGASLGITVREDGSGGGSDGNFTAAMGIPTLDGLGPQGDGLHALHEHVVMNSLPLQAALCAGMVRDWVFES
jgi:glutamate carboxypeptidase